jgi:Tol biopolymer transport system component
MIEFKNLKLFKIVLYTILGMMLFTFSSCKKEETSVVLPDTLGISGEDYYPKWSPDGQKISFISDRYGEEDIYIINPDGTDQTKLTESTATDSGASWSPDGKKIAFHSARNGNLEIYVMDSDGSNQTRLTDNPASDRFPSWSPDGKIISFNSDRDGNWELYSIKADGSYLTRLTDNPAVDRNPTWSPDSSRILFESDRDKNLDIYIMNADGSNQAKLTELPTNDGEPSWSPDGTKIAFLSYRDKNLDVYIMNANGSNKIRLTDHPARERFPRWSPDGSRIVFDSSRDGNREIYAMNVDGSEQTNLTNNLGYDSRASFSPDGQKITFFSDRDLDEEVYVMDADGSNQINLTNNAPKNETFGLTPLPRSELDLEAIPHKLVFQSLRETDGKENWEICQIDPTGLNLINLTNTPDIDERYPQASPDGHRLCMEVIEGEDEMSKNRDVFIMNIDGTEKRKIAENAYQPCWSPDGRYIAYLPGEYPRFSRRGNATKGLEIYDTETGEKKRHPNKDLLHLHCLSWSPDGEWFVATPQVLFKVNDKTFYGLTVGGCTPDIGPEGKHIVWNGTDWNLNIGKLDVDSPQRNVTDHRMKIACEREFWVYRADWSPDGKYLAFTYGFDDEGKSESEREPWRHICICDLTTGKWTQITTEGQFNDNASWVPGGEEK